MVDAITEITDQNPEFRSGFVIAGFDGVDAGGKPLNAVLNSVDLIGDLFHEGGNLCRLLIHADLKLLHLLLHLQHIGI